MATEDGTTRAAQPGADRIVAHLAALYPGRNLDRLARDVADAIGIRPRAPQPVAQPAAPWDEREIMVMTYGDTLLDGDAPPLAVLGGFLERRLAGVVSGVHVLPFFPYTSDDGFAVVDYLAVNPALGDWADVGEIGSEFTLMADLVLNHASRSSAWFGQFERGERPGRDYFVTAEPDTDISAIVRPRTHHLLERVETADGPRHVWCTFSPDQVDLDFGNPEVLLEFLRVIDRYLRAGVRWFRLDAVAYVWKRVGTPCIHLPETHELIRLLRALLERREPCAVIVTETNVPHRENLTYFGNRNEAHAIYNFSLPPLILHALLTGNAEHLKTWMMSMPPAPLGCTYLNFLASHDGIGLRPAEDLLGPHDVRVLADAALRAGGTVAWYATPEGDRPYELNVSLFDLLADIGVGEDGWQMARHACAHTIMMALEGVPAIYVHSLLATSNDLEGVRLTGRPRSINRRRLEVGEADRLLDDPSSPQAQVFTELRRRIALRAGQPAFHPNATQFTLQAGPRVFAFWRQSLDRSQSIFALNNVGATPQEVPLSAINLIATDPWLDLISGRPVTDIRDHLALGPYESAWLTNRIPPEPGPS